MYPECIGDSVLHVYAKLCQLPSLDSISCSEAYQWIRKKPIKMHCQRIRPAITKNKQTKNTIGYIQIK